MGTRLYIYIILPNKLDEINISKKSFFFCVFYFFFLHTHDDIFDKLVWSVPAAVKRVPRIVVVVYTGPRFAINIISYELISCYLFTLIFIIIIFFSSVVFGIFCSAPKTPRVCKFFFFYRFATFSILFFSYTSCTSIGQ